MIQRSVFSLVLHPSLHSASALECFNIFSLYLLFYIIIENVLKNLSTLDILKYNLQIVLVNKTFCQDWGGSHCGRRNLRQPSTQPLQRQLQGTRSVQGSRQKKVYFLVSHLKSNIFF